ADESELSSATFCARCLHRYDDVSFLNLKIKNTETLTFYLKVFAFFNCKLQYQIGQFTNYL
ncbi:MAG: hypothetical protein K2M73_02480, partial [Lachnospiraceae bacterium]|nr:hypothetical protein [Lachnospiraceae bacterium]